MLPPILLSKGVFYKNCFSLSNSTNFPFENAGHWVMIDKAAEFYSSLNDFVRQD